MSREQPWQRVAAAVALAALAGSGVWAHAPGASQVHPLLTPLAPELSALTVQVAETLAPQLLVENLSGKTLEILDDRGRAFVRIGPAGVEADLAAAAWYETVSTAAPPVPEAARDPAAPPRWTLVQREPSFGWFDPRLNVTKVHPDHAAEHASHPVVVGSWAVPVLWDGKPARIAGQFQFRPMPHGAYAASLTPPADFPADIGLRVSQGATPAIFLQNGGARVVTVLGMEGEPYIRLGPAGVEVNTGSPTWRQYGRGNQGEDRGAAGDPPHWLTVSATASYAWLEPRAMVPAELSDGVKHPARRWTIPLDIDGRKVVLDGQSIWTSGM